MMRIIISILLFAAIAFGLGYYFFAQVGDGHFISIEACSLTGIPWGNLY